MAEEEQSPAQMEIRSGSLCNNKQVYCPFSLNGQQILIPSSGRSVPEDGFAVATQSLYGEWGGTQTK